MSLGCIFNKTARHFARLSPLPLKKMGTTYNTYPELIADTGRNARTDWERCSAAQAVAATLRYDNEAIICRATDSTGLSLSGLLPGGLG